MTVKDSAGNYKTTSTHWGPGIPVVENGVLKSVDAHPDDPDPSPINDNIASSLYGKARVTRPAVRKSYLENGPTTSGNDTNKQSYKRGEEPFVEVSWDKALELIADELNRVRDNFGNEAIYGGSYGWASAGRFHHAQSQLNRFLNTCGGFVRSEGNYSYNAALVLMPHIVGNFRDHVKQATRWSTVEAEGQLVVMFGGIPLRNAQVAGGGIAKHRLRDQLVACAEKGIEFINISPLRTDAIDEVNAEWIAPRPNSDTAIMMGLAHTLLSENLHDSAFLERYSVGFDKVSSYLLGEQDGVAKDAAWAELQSGVSSVRIKTLARQMAKQRTLICMAVGLQRAEYGEQPLWMTVTLAAMLGQIGLPGGGYGIGYGADASIGTVDRPIKWPSFPMGNNPISNYIPVANVTEMLLKPKQTYAYNGEVKTYPDIKMVWWAGGNPFHHHQDLNLLREAFQQPETIIVNEINWTATARHADIVLPVASMMERNDIGAGTQDRAIIPMPRAIEAIGEAREEFAIYSELEKRLGLGEAFSEGRTSDEWLAHMWDELTETAKQHGHSLPDFEGFLEGGIISFPDPDPEAVFLSNFRADPDSNPLPTPSGKIELYSAVIDGFNYEDCPGQATWIPPREWLGAESVTSSNFHLISGQPKTRLHSQFDNGEYSKSHKRHGREPVLINPVDAARLDIEDGEVVCLHNERGQCLAAATVTDDVMQQVLFLWTGAWFDPDFSHPQHRDKHGNPNVLTHDFRTSSLAQGPASHSTLVQISKVNSELPTVTAFRPPEFV
jgi:biotin/methionine sulfoxide reductase